MGQQLPQLSSGHWDKYVYNPAYAGSTGVTQFSGHFRSQWQSIDGQPTTQVLTFSTPVDVINSGVGLVILGDQIGNVKRQNILLSYNYMLDLPFGFLSMGLSAGMDRTSFLGNDWRAPEGEYNNLGGNHNDPILSEDRISGLAPQINGGLFFSNDFFEVGVSLQNISPFAYGFGNQLGDITYKQGRSYIFQGSYFYEYNDEILLVPSVLVKKSPNYLQTEIGLGGDYRGIFKGGLYLRGYNNMSIDAAIIQIGYQFIKNTYVYYSFDLGLSKLRTVHDNSHEISLRYIIDEPLFKIQREKVIYNPRFLD
ncbi:type IX secretion system membrane protein PorP/SprF [Membranihabitans marinus]